MKRVLSVKEKGASQIMGSLKAAYHRGFSRGLALGLVLLAACIVLSGSLLYGQTEDALSIDQEGTVNAKKYVGDGSDLKIKTEMGEQTLKNAMALIKQDLDKCISGESGFFNFRSSSGLIESLGQYGPAVIGVKKGDIVKVDLVGSAKESAFYYSIVETTGNAEILSVPTQVIENPDSWRSITTIGLFRAQADTRLWFRANFEKGDLSGKVKVTGLTLIATVVGNVAISGPMNLARERGAEASQSTMAFEGSAERAIDGNTDGNWQNHSITHTADEPDSWWQLKLPKPAIIERIVIWNRTDCCRKRLSNLYISVLNDSNEKVWDKEFAGPIIDADYTLFEVLPPVMGRFVKVQIKGKNKEDNGYLSLAEVEVFGEFTE